jgi:hypothetical protein
VRLKDRPDYEWAFSSVNTNTTEGREFGDALNRLFKISDSD